MPHRTCPVTGLPTGSCECYEYLPIHLRTRAHAEELPGGLQAFIAAMVERYQLVQVEGVWRRRHDSTLPRF